MTYENTIIVINKTRLEQLIERFNTKAQARFYIEHAGGNFNDYETEHETFKSALEKIQIITARHSKFKIIRREFLPNFIFSDSDLILILGQDGLVANTAKYSRGLPMIAINPDQERFDGILLPFSPNSFEKGLLHTLEGKARIQSVTMAEAKLNDGQRLLAFNDFFVGPATHSSARYQLTHNRRTEKQSSSGIIVSTGAGSTGWLSSLLNMANGICEAFSEDINQNQVNMTLSWDAKQLVFVVREPFKCSYSGIELTAGTIHQSAPLQVESFMPVNGKIFSDGLEDDFLLFNSGAIVEIGVAPEKANIVVA